MNLKKRIEKIETRALSLSLQRLFENLPAVSDSQLNRLFELFATERVNRGLVEPPEIEAAKSVFQQLTAQGVPRDEAKDAVLQGATWCGFELTEEDFL